MATPRDWDWSSSAGGAEPGGDRGCPRDGTPLAAELDADDGLRRWLIESGRADTRTIGAVQRERGGWSVEARVLLATALVGEARRRVLVERLDNVMHFLAAGGPPDAAAARLVQLVDEYYGTDCCDCAEGVAA